MTLLNIKSNCGSHFDKMFNFNLSKEVFSHLFRYRLQNESDFLKEDMSNRSLNFISKYVQHQYQYQHHQQRHARPNL